jgi:two-component system, OmpR family, sensor histidine kinase VicK
LILRRRYQGIEVLHSAQVVNAISDLFSGAEDRIDICGNSKFPYKIFSFETVKNSSLVAKNRGTKQRFIFEITKDNINYCKATMNLGNLHHMEEAEANFMLNENAFLGSITLSEPEQAIYSNLGEILEQQHSIFEALWNKSLPAEDMINEIEAGVEPEVLELISDRNKATEIYVDLARSVEKEALFLLADSKAMLRADKLGVIDYLITASSEKGATIKIVCPLDKENSEIVKRISVKAPNIGVQNGGSSHSGLLIVDNARFLRFELKEPKAEEFSDAIGFIVYSNSRVSINSSKSFFELLWNEHIQYERLKEYEKQKEIDKMKNEFINVAAHELRTPIQPILGLSQLLRSKTLSDDEFDQSLDIIIRNANRLQHLANSILDVTRIESYSLKLEKEKVNLNDVIRSVVNDYKAQLEKNNYKLKLEYEAGENVIIVEGDKSRLTQVVSNLLNNSIKFTREGMISIKMELKQDEQGLDTALVSVKDTGSGIDHEIVPKLFSRFASKSFAGTGLGLFIAKSIVEAHRGKIWARNNSNNKNGINETGSTFYFSLPLNKQHVN